MLIMQKSIYGLSQLQLECDYSVYTHKMHNRGFFFDCLVFNYFKFHEAAEGKAPHFLLDGKHNKSTVANQRRSI